jgi:hypothetical protein
VGAKPITTTAAKRTVIAKKNCRSYLRPARRLGRFAGTDALVDTLPFNFETI